MKNFFSKKWTKIGLSIFGVLFVFLVVSVIILQTTFWMKFPPALRSTFALMKLEISIKEGRCDEGCMFERQIFRSIIAQDAKASPAVFSRVEKILFNKKANPKLRAEMVWIYKAIVPEGEIPEDLLGLLEQAEAPDILKQTLIAATTGSSKASQRQLLIAANPKEDEWTRIIALAQLQEHGDISMIDNLIEIMKQDPRGPVGDKAAIAVSSILSEAEQKGILPPLTQFQKEYFIDVLTDANNPVDRREEMILILNSYKTEEIIKLFEKMLEDKCGGVRFFAARSLKYITDKEHSYKPMMSVEEELKICPDY